MSAIGPAQGGTAVLGAAAANAGVNAIRGMPATGARALTSAVNHSRELILVGVALLAGAAMIAKGGRGSLLSAGDDLDE